MAVNPLSETDPELGSRQKDDILDAKKEKTKYCTSLFKAFCCYFRLIILVVFVSFATSIISSNYFCDNQRNHATNRLCCEENNLDTNGLNQNISRFAKGNGCCMHLKYLHILLGQENKLHKREISHRRIGAQLCANQTLLNDNPPSLAWSHVNSDSFLDDINHVTHYHGNHTYDCLELTRDDRYIMSIQLTYRYTATTPSEAVRSYFTLTKFGGGNVVVVAKSDFTIPDPRKRNNITVKQPITMVRSDQLISGDRLCVTVAHPELIYASQIDNFFGVFSL